MATKKKLGEYVECNSEIIVHALAEQRQLAAKGQAKRLGELLLEKNALTRKSLHEAIMKQRLDRLQASRLFSGVSLAELLKMRYYVSEMNAAQGEQFITQDTQGDCFYILADGHASVYRMGDYGEKVPLGNIEPGECIGEMGHFSDGRRSACVQATEPVQLLAIKYADLEIIFDAIPGLTKNFLGLITERLRRTNRQFQESALKEHATKKSLEALRDLLDFSELLTLSAGIEGLIDRVVITASKVMNAERASLFLLDNFRGELWSKTAEGMGGREIRIPVGRGIAGWVAQNGQVLNIRDPYEDPRFDSSVDDRTGYLTRSVLCGPVKNLHGEPVGVIEVINKIGGAFDARDEALFKAFAYQAAIAVENFRLCQRLMANHEKMAILLDVATSVAQTLDLDSLIVTIVNKVSEILNAERGTLFLLDQKTDELWSKVALESELAEIRIPASTGLAGYVVSSGQVVNIKDAYQDPRFNPAVDRRTGFRTKTVLCAPVISRNGDIIGATQAINKRAGEFDREDEDLLRALSCQIALALENAQLFEQTLNMKNYLASVQESITNSILTLDGDHRVITANKAAIALFKLTDEGPAKKDIRAIIGPDNQGLIELIDDVYATHRSVVDYDVKLVLPGQTDCSVNLNFVPLMDHMGEEQGLVLVFEDITREKRMKSTLTRYMAKDIVERLLKDPAQQALGGTRSKATILFSDIRDFVGIAEGMHAEQTVDFLNDYFSLMVDIVFEEKGVLDKYIGDAIMAVFGVPYSQGDDAKRAVKTALRMISTLRDLNDRRRASIQAPISVGVGVCTGEVVSGNIGSQRRMDFTVIGDEVNLCSRLESLSKYYRADILISEFTQEEVGDQFTTRLVDKVIVKGKKKAVKIYQVLGERDIGLSRAQECFCQGLELYHKGAFEKARRFFEEGLEDDPVCQIFLDRCVCFFKQPPSPGWDGTWVWLEK
jgi:adenylate cyclase